MPFPAPGPLHLLWQAVLILAKREVEARELSQQNRGPTEAGEGTTVDGEDWEEEDFRDPGQAVRRVGLPDLFPNRRGKTLGFDSWSKHGKVHLGPLAWHHQRAILLLALSSS